ncbi:MAG: hypothetical protein H7122_01535 [Chitinophagaceae bacterium]|nr:hypothetical protein [Chitinophagaceae bacterium]
MKKNLSIASCSLVAMGLLMGSCVSKRKYMEAQTSASERYRTDSSQWADRSNTMQTNITSMEQKNTAYKSQVDSLRTSSMNYQKRWDNIQSTYTTQNSSTEQLHQQIHTAIDQYVEASNVESKNGKIYVNLPENMLFNAGNSTISSKGKQALDKLAEVLAASNSVDVDIIATAAYYSDGTAANMNDDATVKTNADATTDKNSAKDSVTDKTSAAPATANIGDSAYAGSGTKTKQDPAKKTTATATISTSKKTNATVATKKSNQGDRSMSFKSTPKKSTKAKASAAPSWNMNVARSTSIVRELTNNGLPHARIVLTGQNGKGMTTNEWASTNRGYQIVISPKMDSYYQMMQEGQGSTSMK